MINAKKLIENLQSKDPLIRQAAITAAKNLSISDRNELVREARPYGGMTFLDSIINTNKKAPETKREEAGKLLEDRIEQERKVLTETDFWHTYKGDGIITIVENVKELGYAWLLIRSLRAVGYTKPVQVWHSITDVYINSFSNFTPVSFSEVRKSACIPCNDKSVFAIMNSPFEKVLFISPYTIALKNPENMFVKDIVKWVALTERNDAILLNKSKLWRNILLTDTIISARKIKMEAALSESLKGLSSEGLRYLFQTNSAQIHETMIHYDGESAMFQATLHKPPKTFAAKGMEKAQERTMWANEFNQLLKKEAGRVIEF